MSKTKQRNPFHADDISSLAKSIRTQIAELESTPSQSQMLNILAKAAGKKNYQHFLKSPTKYSIAAPKKPIAEQGGWTIEGVFEDEAIENYIRTSSNKFSFWLKGLPTKITVLLTPQLNTHGYDYHLSHFIKTPEQMSYYRPSNRAGDYFEYALHQAVTAITMYYQAAVDAGHTPQEAWLVESNRV